MTDLSPVAQTVLNAVKEICPAPADEIAATALRAAAAEAPPEIDIPFAIVDEWERIEGVCASYYAAAAFGYKQALDQFLAIAAELEGAQ